MKKLIVTLVAMFAFSLVAIADEHPAPEAAKTAAEAPAADKHQKGHKKGGHVKKAKKKADAAAPAAN